MEKKDILCPDCAVTYISEKQYTKFGKCMSCYRREYMSKNNNVAYIKFVDLSDEEKVRITRQRETKRNSAQKIRQSNKETPTKDKVGTKQKSTNRNQIYTDDVIEQIKAIASETITPKELLEMIQSMYPEKAFTSANLNNILVRHNIPHSSKRGRRTYIISANVDEVPVDKIFSSVIDQDKNTENIKEENNVVIGVVNQTGLSANTNVNCLEYSKEAKLIDRTIEDNEPERFIPIREEVNSVMQKRFRALGCSLSRDYDTTDYINMIDMLIYLVENGQTIVNNRRSQQNIMNAYQSDILHTMENTIAEDGDTYLGDKMHIVRNYRRHFEMDYRDVATLRSLRESLDVSMLKTTLTNLKKNLNYVENPVFKPLVDTTMADKYEWAKDIDSNSAKSNISVTKYNPTGFQKANTINGRPITRIGMGSNTVPTSQMNSKMQKKLKVFRVSAKVSGGGYGAFTNWYRDYECSNSKTALAYATNTLNQLCNNKKGMIYNDVSCVELNVGPIKEEITPSTSTQAK